MPPFCFSRHECISLLQDSEQPSNLHMECPYCANATREALVRVLDAVSHEVVVSYHLGAFDEDEGSYPNQIFVQGLQTLLERKADVLCWVSCYCCCVFFPLISAQCSDL